MVDIILLTIFYHDRYKIKYYQSLICLLGVIIFALKISVQFIYMPIIQGILLSCFLMTYTKDKKSLAFFELPMIFIYIVDILMIETLQINYVLLCIFNAIVKTLAINMAHDINNLKIIGRLENFTIKTLVIIFIFINVLMGVYLFAKGV